MESASEIASESVAGIVTETVAKTPQEVADTTGTVETQGKDVVAGNKPSTSSLATTTTPTTIPPASVEEEVVEQVDEIVEKEMEKERQAVEEDKGIQNE